MSKSLTLTKINSHKIVFLLIIIYCYSKQHIIITMLFIKNAFVELHRDKRVNICQHLY